MVAQASEGECAIVEAGAMPEACAATIEADARAENCVEEARAKKFQARGFMHAEFVLTAAVRRRGTNRMRRARMLVMRGR